VKQKQPYFPFYPGDWMKDPSLRAISSAARGFWIDMLCLMWESPRRGYLIHPTGRAVSIDQLARMTGNPLRDTARMLRELEECGVTSRTGDGILYSRRMERDERLRMVRSEAGKLGGNPNIRAKLKEELVENLVKQNPKQTASKPEPDGQANVKQTGNQNPTLSFSSSVSVKQKAKDPPLEIPPDDSGKAKNATSWPKDFSLTEDHRQYALSKGVFDPEDAWEHFGNYHQAKGNRFRDWNRAWYTWCQNQKNFARHGSRSGTKDISEMSEEEVVAFLNEPRERL
jgi:hypothetical protein